MSQEQHLPAVKEIMVDNTDCRKELASSCLKNRAIKINTNNLYEGMVVKNYRLLCELVGVKPTSGGAKENQLKEFSRFFEFEKVKNSNKLIIHHIYKEPIEKMGNYRTGIFINQLKVMVLWLLKNKGKRNESNEVFMETSYTRIIKDLELVNCDFFAYNIYSFFKEKFPKFFYYKDYTTDQQFLDFKNTVWQKIKSNVVYALKSLQKDNLVTFTAYHIVFLNDMRSRKATVEEEEYIATINQQIARKLRYSNSIYASYYKHDDFKKLFRMRINKDKQWTRIEYRISIKTTLEVLSLPICSFTYYQLQTSVEQMADGEERKYILDFNEKLVDLLKKQVKDRNENFKKKLAQDSNKAFNLDIDTTMGIFDDVIVYDEEYQKKDYLLIYYLVLLGEKNISTMKPFFCDFIRSKRT